MIEGIEIKIGTQSFIVPAMNLKGVKELEQKLQTLRSATLDATALTAEQVELIAEIVLIGLKRNYPEITKEYLEEILDMNNIMSVIEAVTGQAGLKKNLVTAPETASPSTGTSSTVN